MIAYYIVYFTITSFIGYIYECIAMTMWSGKWENRGFLYGPVIPIYGYGALIGLVLFEYFIKDYSVFTVFVTGFVGSIVLEYPTSWALEKLFHAYWWDYSSAPFNINGRVSLFSSLGFGVAALIIVYIINPILWPFLLGLNIKLISVLSYIFIVLYAVDTTLTVSVLSGFESRVQSIELFINERLTDKVEDINPKGRNIKGAIRYTKDNIIDSGVDKAVNTMDYFYHETISRVKGFKNSSSDIIQIIKSKIKDKVDSIRNRHER